MTLLRVYIALSLDGYIADSDGGVGWLDPFVTDEFDYPGFMATIGAGVMGRKTYDFAIRQGPWPYKELRSFVMTRGELTDPPLGVETFNGDVRTLRDTLTNDLQDSGKDVWLMGGGESILSFHEAGIVDRWELFWIPVLLGDGIPLFPRGGPATALLKPTHTKTYSNGIVECWYEPQRPSQK